MKLLTMKMDLWPGIFDVVPGNRQECRCSMVDYEGSMGIIEGKVFVFIGSMGKFDGKLSILNGGMGIFDGKMGKSVRRFDILSGKIDVLNGRIGKMAGELAKRPGELMFLVRGWAFCSGEWT